jgi:hypothetical protein
MCMWYSLPSSLGYRLVAVSSTLNLLWGVQWLALARGGCGAACAYALRPPCQCRKPTALKTRSLFPVALQLCTVITVGGRRAVHAVKSEA